MIADFENISLYVSFDKIFFKDWIWSILSFYFTTTAVWKIKSASIILKQNKFNLKELLTLVEMYSIKIVPRKQ
jgi:hypothetical protein